MPSRPNTPCRHPGCAALVPYGTKYCDAHKPMHPDQCGMIEAMEQAGITEKKPLTEWAAVKIPQIGGGRWKR